MPRAGVLVPARPRSSRPASPRSPFQPVQARTENQTPIPLFSPKDRAPNVRARARRGTKGLGYKPTEPVQEVFV